MTGAARSGVRALERCTWPLAELGLGLEALARHAGLPLVASFELPPPPSAGADRWLEAAARALGLEAEPVEVAYAELSTLVRRAAPAVLKLAGEEPRFLLLVATRGGRAMLLAPDLTLQRRPIAELREALAWALEDPQRQRVEAILEATGLATKRHARARRALMQRLLAAERLDVGWLLRLAAGASFWAQLRQARLDRRLAVVLTAHLGQYLLWLLGWWVLGGGALAGRLDPAWLFGWGLLLITLVPLRALATWSRGRFVYGAGALLKRRLLAGVLRLHPDEVRHQGAGQMLSRVLDSEAVESLALGGGFGTLIAVLELTVAVWILALGAGGRSHVVLLALWLALTAGLAGMLYRRRQRWTVERLDMTHDLVERMVGHRTRVAQEAPESWHDGEDERLARYLRRTREMDRIAVWLGLLPGAWLATAALALAPAVVGVQASAAGIAVALGGMLLTRQALASLVQGLEQLVGATISWRQVVSLFAAARRRPAAGAADLQAALVATPAAGMVLEARDLVYSYPDRSCPAVAGCHLQITAGDRLLLEGPSGGGKSTLMALLVGLRQPDAGLLLLRGVDRHAVGEDVWRQQVAAVPQFHDNHVLTETFAFNLLMGRRWPPAAADLREAEEICRELGLGDLLERMPSGMQQMVGESGWQLSHGERSRLFIARALLGRAELLVLDESFAALDPENLQLAMRAVTARAPTLMVIAHP